MSSKESILDNINPPIQSEKCEASIRIRSNKKWKLSASFAKSENASIQFKWLTGIILTDWGRVTHICVSKIIIIGSNNGLSPGRRQAIIWTNARILLIEPLGTYFSKILIEIHTFSFKKMHSKMSSAKWRLFRLGLNVLIKQWPASFWDSLLTTSIAM